MSAQFFYFRVESDLGDCEGDSILRLLVSPTLTVGHSMLRLVSVGGLGVGTDLNVTRLLNTTPHVGEKRCAET